MTQTKHGSLSRTKALHLEWSQATGASAYVGPASINYGVRLCFRTFFNDSCQRTEVLEEIWATELDLSGAGVGCQPGIAGHLKCPYCPGLTWHKPWCSCAHSEDLCLQWGEWGLGPPGCSTHGSAQNVPWCHGLSHTWKTAVIDAWHLMPIQNTIVVWVSLGSWHCVINSVNKLCNNKSCNWK